MLWRAIGLLFAAVLTGTLPARARAEVHSYALVVGADRGGTGQEPLRYAGADATQFAALLVELGRVPREAVKLLLQPTPEAIAGALDALRVQLTEHARKGEHAKLFFYYSGHARAHALSLAGAELPLDALRAQLLALPSTLTVVVLDACQSGAFSGLKGATLAGDFATSSVSELQHEGVAVMASSTGAELSQESSELGGSYFTHHLLTALRGAAERDRDGHISLDEAYAYAYHNTLSDTLRTRVGSQHATLEIELKGHGQVPLTYPVDADAQLQLPADLSGRVVVQQQGRGAVLAELAKGLGAQLSLALPHGAYEVLVRSTGGHVLRSCAVNLAQHTTSILAFGRCPIVNPPELIAAKGPSVAFERWFVELGAARRFARDDAYTDTLDTFSFRDVGDFVLADDAGSFRPQVTAGIGLSPHWSLLQRVEGLQKREFERRLRSLEGEQVVGFRWRTLALSLGLRARVPLWRERLVPFAEAGLGFGFARSAYTREDADDDVDWQAGPFLHGGVGATVQLIGRVGLLLSVGYDYARALGNEFDQTRDDGGLNIALALRVRGLKGAFHGE